MIMDSDQNIEISASFHLIGGIFSTQIHSFMKFPKSNVVDIVCINPGPKVILIWCILSMLFSALFH